MSGEPDKGQNQMISAASGAAGAAGASLCGACWPGWRAVSRAISALRLTPVLFEAGARPHPPPELYRAYLAQSDVFVGIYWQRYGEVGLLRRLLTSPGM